MQELNFQVLNNFCALWLRKANRINTSTLEGVFDRFFTLWVVFNRLYEEAGRTLVHRGHPIYRPSIARRGRSLFAPPPDRISATKGIAVFVGHGKLRDHILGDREAVDGLQYIHDSIRAGIFYLHENYETGEPDTAKDIDLVKRAMDGCVVSTLTLLYQARCNLFHGQKAFTESQRMLLNGLSAILSQVIRCSLQTIEERTKNA